MRTIFSRVRLSGKSVAALLALMLLSAVTSMLLPTALASMIDVGVAGQSRSAIVVVAAVMAALSILGCVFNVAATVLSAKVSTRFAADLRHEIFHQVQSFSAAEMERFGTASLVTRSTSDVTNVQMFLSLLLRLGVTAPLMAVAGLVLSSLTGGELSSVLDLAIPALILGAGVIILLVSRYSVTLRRQIDRLNKLFLETLEGVRVIRAFNRQDREMERFAQANGEQIGHVRPNHHLVNARIADHLPHAVQRFQRLVVRLAFVRKGKAQAGLAVVDADNVFLTANQREDLRGQFLIVFSHDDFSFFKFATRDRSGPASLCWFYGITKNVVKSMFCVSICFTALPFRTPRIETA